METHESVTGSGPKTMPHRRLGVLPRNAHPYAWLALLATWGVWLFNSFDYNLMYSLGPVIIHEFKLNAAFWANALAVWTATRVVVDIPLAILSDRYGSGWRRRNFWAIVVFGYALVSFAAGFKALSVNVWSYFVLRSGVTIGGTACEAIGVTASSEWWPNEERGFAVGTHHTGFPLGGLVAGEVTALFLTVFGVVHWRWVFFVSLASLPFIALYWWVSRPTHFDLVYRRIDQNGLSRPHSKELSVSSTLSGWREVLRKREIVVTALYLALFMAVYILFISVFPAYLAFVQGYSYAVVAALSFIWPVSGAFFQFLLPSISDRIGRKKILVAAGLYAGIIMLLMQFATSLLGIILVQVLYGVVLNAVYPIGFSIAAEVAPRARVATAVSVTTAALWLGAAVASFAGGHLVQAGGGFESVAGYLWTFYVMAGLSFLAGIIQIFTRETVRHAGYSRVAARAGE